MARALSAHPRARARLAAFRAEPRKHARHGIKVLLKSNVKEIGTDKAILDQEGKKLEVRNDAVIVSAGGVLPTPFLNIAIAPYRTIEHGGIRVFYFPEDSAGAARLLNAADRALYIAKREGRNRVYLASGNTAPLIPEK